MALLRCREPRRARRLRPAADVVDVPRVARRGLRQRRRSRWTSSSGSRCRRRVRTGRRPGLRRTAPTGTRATETVRRRVAAVNGDADGPPVASDDAAEPVAASAPPRRRRAASRPAGPAAGATAAGTADRVHPGRPAVELTSVHPIGWFAQPAVAAYCRRSARCCAAGFAVPWFAGSALTCLMHADRSPRWFAGWSSGTPPTPIHRHTSGSPRGAHGGGRRRMKASHDRH